ncbi:linear gramicidin synthetase subunit D domain protein [Mycobacterium xenopi 4042]|uniref:Linear gramicidin synthetase subunit D domain protein n=1 Tax=Mycobacterium xenopi 4042 TaxID=1299334 RepID=X8AR19_MYCXE|nr:putative syringomycin synthetase [Mycobacterium xenopi 3993]EUA33488.1 linear gramicidin synthetase subunit D domain protein [Mycobacterium xenopi 4042]
MYWEPLMLQRFAYSRVDVFTKLSNCRLRCSFQYQGYKAGNHPRHRLCFRAHAPAYREIENHLRPLAVAPA